MQIIKTARGRITSEHGESIDRARPHVGIDIGNGQMTEDDLRLVAPAAGWLTWATVGTYGERAIIAHADRTWSLLAHAERYHGVNGRHVEQREEIGVMGRTGGPWGAAGWYVHAHQEYHLADGTAVNPLDYMAGAAGGGITPITPTKLTTSRRRSMFELTWAGGTAYLTTDGGSTPIANPTVYNLLYRVRNLNPLFTPFKEAVSGQIGTALQGTPMAFTPAEQKLVDQTMRLHRASLTTGVAIDHAKLADAISDALGARFDVNAEIDPVVLSKAFDQAIPRIATAVANEAARRLAS